MASDLAQSVLDEVNFARTQPQGYARILAGRAGEGSARETAETIHFLERARPAPALAWSEGMSHAALSHVLDIGAIGGRGHSGTHGGLPWDRMSRFGQWQGRVGENIDYGHREARSIVISLLIDHGVPGRGHRTNLFDRGFHFAGIAAGTHAGYGSMCVMDFAGSYAESGDLRVSSRSTTSNRSLYSGMSFF